MTGAKLPLCQEGRGVTGRHTHWSSGRVRSMYSAVRTDICWSDPPITYSFPSSTADAWHFRASIIGGPSDQRLVRTLKVRNLLRALRIPALLAHRYKVLGHG